MNIVGLTGTMASGKDWTYQWFHDKGYSALRESFADQVRKDIEDHTADGMHLGPLWRKPYPPEIRALLQWWGTDMRRNQDPEYWLHKMSAKLQVIEASAYADMLTVFITDVRFPNEADLVKNMGGEVWRIWAPEGTRRERLGLSVQALQELDQHPSERAMLYYPVDATFSSTGIVPRGMDSASELRLAYIIQNTERSSVYV